jgi:hypothetical protein
MHSMNTTSLLSRLDLTRWLLPCAIAAFPVAARGADLIHAKDGSGVYGYNDTPVLPWCGFRVHDADRPAPKRVDPGPAPVASPAAPSDAIVLVHLNEPIHGETGHRILPTYRQRIAKGPLQLSGHDCPVRFRNIWVCRL